MRRATCRPSDGQHDHTEVSQGCVHQCEAVDHVHTVSQADGLAGPRSRASCSFSSSCCRESEIECSMRRARHSCRSSPRLRASTAWHAAGGGIGGRGAGAGGADTFFTSLASFLIKASFESFTSCSTLRPRQMARRALSSQSRSCTCATRGGGTGGSAWAGGGARAAAAAARGGGRLAALAFR